MRHIPTVYLVLVGVAVAITLAGMPVVAGADADPLAGVFAFLLALPWIAVLEWVEEPSFGLTMGIAVLGMAANYGILRRLFRRRQPTASNGDLPG